MPASTTTTNFNFPQYAGSDFPSFIKDFNPAFKTIDTTMKANADGIKAASSAASSASQSAQTANAAAQRAQQAADNVVALLTALGVSNEEEANAFKAKVDNAVPKHAILASYFDKQ